MTAPNDSPEPSPPAFDETFRAQLAALFAWRRDVRRFRRDPLPPALIERLLDLAVLAPSVGNAQPWRFVSVETPERRAAIIRDFEQANAAAARLYRDEQAALYARLKLEGLKTAPTHLAVFCDETVSQGAGLGRQTMPETLRYSVVGAIQTLWLAARAHGVGMGWVSILHPETINATLDLPAHWVLVAYLCLGYPEEEHLDPELERHGWQARTGEGRRLLRR
ncbi:5,6-dimethylbenzimidazole synthase [Hypericibacter adhaerens]|jgi:5,6-dimethylbenzimidazole synthase|uniref:5,6-dimethylbenzimidazole synthase n=1 Tax=Hypericibacter adhaerens TaxID=2602016 RepID=A0A5J6NB45_9PROT|nr:5,6-dimethylbenzimidazole synthase [Hypericibacter adhaerens]QEX25196.1 5,6-dimethylbenzimidazole synthase [Hypericibacter adhaerens]